MNFCRSHRKALSLASLTLISALGLSACVNSYLDYYDDDYYPPQRTVVVKHTPPVYQRVEVYETAPRVIVARPRPHYYHHYNRPTKPVIIHQRPDQYPDKTVIVNPGRHQQQKIILKQHQSYQEPNSRIIKSYRPYNNETHTVRPTDSTQVKQTKKIVIDRQGDAPPSTLSE